MQARWPGAGVHLFGSTATRLNLRKSNDLDISLDLPEVEDKVRGNRFLVDGPDTSCVSCASSI